MAIVKANNHQNTTALLGAKLIACIALFLLVFHGTALAANRTGVADMVDVAVSDAVGLNDPTLSFNLDAVNDWSTEMPFLDIFKSARPWIGHTSSTWNAASYDSLMADGTLDANGWPTEIPAGLDSIGTIWSWGDASAAQSRAGVYVLNYEGEGTINLSKVNVLSSEPGQIVFENTSGGDWRLDITDTDPNGTGNYIHDITVVKEENVPLFEAGAVFNPDFLSIIDDARELRFMDWMRTNGSEKSAWADRPTSTDAVWTTSGGVPLEVMVQLANEAGVDPWFTIPQAADDDYVRQFAAYVHDHLDPSLKAHVEYANEAWNPSLPAYHWLEAQSLAAWGESAPFDYYAKRATEVAVIWEQVYGSDSGDRLVNILGTQASNSWISERLLNAPVWLAHEPDTFVDPASVFEELAATTYFGNATITNADLRAELLAAINDPSVDATQFLYEKLQDPTYARSIPQIQDFLDSQKAVADAHGLGLVAYEGGQHVHHSFAVSGLSATDLTALTDFMTDFVRSPEMADLYRQLWDAWASVGDGAFMQFGDVGSPSKFGSWALYSFLGDENPRAAMLDSLNGSTPNWWGEAANSAYQHGVQIIGTDGNDAIAGTTQEDYLVGGAGDDIFNAGTGNDGINGGAGYDQLILSGSANSYTISAHGAGYLLVGPDGTDYVVNVEGFIFDGQVSYLLQQMLDGISHTDAGGGATAGSGGGEVQVPTDGGEVQVPTDSGTVPVPAGNGAAHAPHVNFAHSNGHSLFPTLQESSSLTSSDLMGVSNTGFLTSDGTHNFSVQVVDNHNYYAQYKNVLGVYEVDENNQIVDVRLLSNNVKTDAGNAISVDGIESGHVLGFFIVQNAAEWANTLSDTDELMFAPSGSGRNATLELTVNGVDADVTVFHALDSTLNTDGEIHVVSGLNSDGTSMLMGFEDLTGGGDHDYEDVVISITTDEFLFA